MPHILSQETGSVFKLCHLWCPFGRFRRTREEQAHPHPLTILDGSHSEPKPNFFLSSAASSLSCIHEAPLSVQGLSFSIWKWKEVVQCLPLPLGSVCAEIMSDYWLGPREAQSSSSFDGDVHIQKSRPVARRLPDHITHSWGREQVGAWGFQCQFSTMSSK